MKRVCSKEICLVLSLLLVISLLSIAVIAQNETEGADSPIDANTDALDNDLSDETEGQKKVFDELNEEYKDEKIKSPGLSPDSPFYFIDELLDNFGDDIGNKEEKIAEIKAMVEAGDIESAKKALEKYNEYAEKIEKEIDPKKREEARRSASAINNALEEIKDQIPEEEKDNFYNDIRKSEGTIVTAVEISSKIKELCEQLSDLDPDLFYQNCRTDDEGPKWQKDMYKDLTTKQKKEAEKFANIMKQCFKTSGQDCKCDEIPFPDFADACSIAAPLAKACDIDKDERACEKLDNLKMPELPPHLQSVMDSLEQGMMYEKFDMHMPKECVDAGAKTPKECSKIMIETNAPEECKQALLAANIENERQGKEICDKIMMEIHSPECAEQGITDPDECARSMMPPECKGMGGEECRKYMDSFRKDDFMNQGPKMNFDCKSIKDPTERLDCYDKAGSQTQGFKGGFDDENYNGPCMTDSDWKAKKQECKSMYGQNAGDEPIMGDSGDGYECVIDARCIDFSQGKMNFDDIKQKEKECANSCSAKGGRWDFSYGECKCYTDEYKKGPEDGNNGPAGCDDCANKCPGASGTGCVDNRCECYYEDNQPQYDPGEGPGPEYTEPPQETPTEPEPMLEPPLEPEPAPSDNGGDSGVTGEVISDVSGNGFLDYFFR